MAFTVRFSISRPSDPDLLFSSGLLKSIPLHRLSSHVMIERPTPMLIYRSETHSSVRSLTSLRPSFTLALTHRCATPTQVNAESVVKSVYPPNLDASAVLQQIWSMADLSYSGNLCREVCLCHSHLSPSLKPSVKDCPSLKAPDIVRHDIIHASHVISCLDEQCLNDFEQAQGCLYGPTGVQPP